MKDVYGDDETYMEYDSGMTIYILLILKELQSGRCIPLYIILTCIQEVSC